jgi:hypothetical protein
VGNDEAADPSHGYKQHNPGIDLAVTDCRHGDCRPTIEQRGRDREDLMRNCQRGYVVHAAVFLLLLTPGAVGAQDQPSGQPQTQPTDQSPAPPPPPPPVARPTDSGKQSGILASPDRILDIVPNFVTVNDTDANRAPLTTPQKYKLAWVSSEDFSAHIGNAVEAGIQQWLNGEPHYGRNLAAFGKRFAAEESDQFSSEMFMRGLLPSLLKEDPRYFRAGRGSAWARVTHAVGQAFVTRTDSGGHTFNTPSILGQFMQAGVSNLYYPRQDRSVNGTVKDVGINVVYGAAFNVLKEFYPDALNKLRRRHVTSPAVFPQGEPQ